MTYFGYFVPLFGQNKLRKYFIISLILNKFSYDKVQIHCLHKQQANIEVFYVMRLVFYTILFYSIP